ncbi:MAG: M1 family metallopeptidase [Rhodothermales bacterium]
METPIPTRLYNEPLSVSRRIMPKHIFLFCVALLINSGISAAQPVRPKPYPVFPIPRFEEAVSQGTRTESGIPGSRYWTNRSRYEIQADLSPATATLRARATATYVNNSPDDLDRVYVHLHQNLHAPGVVRNRPQKLTGGVHLAGVGYRGEPLVERSHGGPGYYVDGTVMEIELPDFIASGDSATFDFAWTFEVPGQGAPRMGHDHEVFFLAYWYPQFAVFDDVHGWVAEPYMGDGEFYADFADFDVSITVPQGWLVAATGVLTNPEEVLSSQTRERLESVNSTTETIHIVREDEREAGMSTAVNDRRSLTWRFRAEDVRDFTFGTSDEYVWDATLADAGDGRLAQIHTLYRPEEAAWSRSAEFARFAIEFLSDFIMPYPYPHMTAVEGIVRGGMEFPMMTLIGGNRSSESLFGTAFHEISHMWFPMVVASNEKHYAWMDEGFTSFNTNEGSEEFWQTDSWDGESYYRLAGTGEEVEPMRHADQYPYGTMARTTASYSKPAVALHALEFVMGEETFRRAYREYARRWAFKHPYPYDFFNTMEEFAGRDLDWFWTSLFYETWTLDHAITDVDLSNTRVRVVVEDQGLTPMPVAVRVTYADGMTAEQVISEDVWLEGERVVPLEFTPGEVVRIELDPGRFLPDVDLSDNVWERSETAEKVR